LKFVADQDRCFAYLSGKSTHLQRQTGVTEADRAVVSIRELCAGPAIKAQFRALLAFLEVVEGDVMVTPPWW
jgi:hypothetical protein